MGEIHQFDILTKIGSGSFGTVYKVRRKADQLLYVIKNIRIVELAFKEQNDAINECQILAQLDSPYVVKYFDSFIERGALLIVMEYCNRGDLANLVKKAKEKSVICVNEPIVWNVFLQVMLGLFYIHRKKILHRDLKTANVFLTKEENKVNYAVKIGDLGVAKMLDTFTAKANTIVGTPYYLSPELCADQPYGDKSDVWAMGVMLYECATLRHPFDARNQCALIMKIIQVRIRSVLLSLFVLLHSLRVIPLLLLLVQYTHSVCEIKRAINAQRFCNKHTAIAQ
jgi:NIMA (never in mitosis gene a)-related kinase